MKYKIILIILIFSVFLSGSYHEDILEIQIETVKEHNLTKYLSEETSDTLKKLGLGNLDYETLFSYSAKDFVYLFFEKLMLKISEPIKAVLIITAAAIICAVADSFCDNFEHCGTVINSVSALSAASVFLFPIKDSIVSSANMITECSNFMLGFIPVYSSAITASGYVSSGIGYRTLMLGTATIISKIFGEIAVPLIGIYLAISIAGSVSGIKTGEIAKSVKNFATWLFCGIMVIFSGIMGLGTLVSASSDNVVSKAAKFIVGSAVPIVGGTVADSLSTVRSCLSITKNILGTYAIVIIVVIFLPSLISLFLWRVSLSVSSGIGDILGNKNLSSLLSSASSVVGIMLSLVTVTIIMFIFSVSIMLMTGGGL